MAHKNYAKIYLAELSLVEKFILLLIFLECCVSLMIEIQGVATALRHLRFVSSQSRVSQSEQRKTLRHCVIH